MKVGIDGSCQTHQALPLGTWILSVWRSQSWSVICHRIFCSLLGNVKRLLGIDKNKMLMHSNVIQTATTPIAHLHNTKNVPSYVWPKLWSLMYRCLWINSKYSMVHMKILRIIFLKPKCIQGGMISCVKGSLQSSEKIRNFSNTKSWDRLLSRGKVLVQRLLTGQEGHILKDHGIVHVDTPCIIRSFVWWRAPIVAYSAFLSPWN